MVHVCSLVDYLPCIAPVFGAGGNAFTVFAVRFLAPASAGPVRSAAGQGLAMGLVCAGLNFRLPKSVRFVAPPGPWPTWAWVSEYRLRPFLKNTFVSYIREAGASCNSPRKNPLRAGVCESSV